MPGEDWNELTSDERIIIANWIEAGFLEAGTTTGATLRLIRAVRMLRMAMRVIETIRQAENRIPS